MDNESNALTTSTVTFDGYFFDPQCEIEPEKPFYDGFISMGDLVIWLGREKHRKSNVILQLAVSLAIGRPFLNMPFRGTTALKVVYVDYESKTGTIKRRYEAITAAMTLTEAEKELLKVNLHIFEVRRAQTKGRALPRFPIRSDAKAEEYWQNFIEASPAALYILDPMRCVHAGDENDSAIEILLTKLRQAFRGATIIIAQHMRKAGPKRDRIALTDNMREWSDGGRGSGAIKAHSDVIVCQERVETGDERSERVYFGAFSKDGADIPPMPLAESGPESFYFEVVPEVPEKCRPSYEALKRANRPFEGKKDAVELMMQTGISRASAYRHFDELLRLGLVVENASGVLELSAASNCSLPTAHAMALKPGKW